MIINDKNTNLEISYIIGEFGEKVAFDEIFNKEKTDKFFEHEYDLDIVVTNKYSVLLGPFLQNVNNYKAICEVKTTGNENKKKFKLNGYCGINLYIAQLLNKPICIMIIRINKKIIESIKKIGIEKTIKKFKKKVRIEFYDKNGFEISLDLKYVKIKPKKCILIQEYGGFRPKLTEEQKYIINNGINKNYKISEGQKIKNMIELENILIGYAHIFIENEDYYKALSCLIKVIVINSKNAVTWILLHQILQFGNIDIGALEHLFFATSLNLCKNKDLELNLKFGLLSKLIKENKIQIAKHLIDIIKKEYPDNERTKEFENQILNNIGLSYELSEVG